MIFQGTRTSIAKKKTRYFCDFSRGGGRDPLSPPLWIRPWVYIVIHVSYLKKSHLIMIIRDIDTISTILHFFSCFYFSTADFVQNKLFSKKKSGMTLKCQTVLIRIGPGLLSVLTWVQNCLQRLSADVTIGKELKCGQSPGPQI